MKQTARLTTLKPRLTAAVPPRVATLEMKAGATPRIRGRAWMATRERIALAYLYRCVDCDRIWMPSRDHIDHDVPLEDGGSNDDANLRPRCVSCHETKTTAEGRKRWGG